MGTKDKKNKKIFLLPTDSHSAFGVQTTHINQLLQHLNTPTKQATPSPK